MSCTDYIVFTRLVYQINLKSMKIHSTKLKLAIPFNFNEKAKKIQQKTRTFRPLYNSLKREIEPRTAANPVKYDPLT